LAALLLLSALMVVPGSEPPSQGFSMPRGTVAEPAPALPQGQGDLVAYVNQRPRAARGSERYALPPVSELALFQEVVSLLARGQAEAAARRSASLHYRVVDFLDTGTGRRFWVLEDAASQPRHHGTYIISQSWQRNLVFHVTHPVYDVGTPEQGARLFLGTRARALLVSDTHRCASATPSGCSGSGPCGASVISDMSHSCQTYFQAAHRALDGLGAISVSLHGFARRTGEPHAIVSDGTIRRAGDGALAVRLAAVLHRLIVEAGDPAGAVSCNAGQWQQLCGTTNVQGRLSNGSARPCTEPATTASGRFIHLEQSSALRRGGGAVGPELVLRAFAEVVPLHASP
jgi:hypothetical protein